MSDSMINVSTSRKPDVSGTGTSPEEGHNAWLRAVSVELAGQKNQWLKSQWFTHEEWTVKLRSCRLAHYGVLDPMLGADTLWRFCSKPSTETIHIARGTGIDTIIDVVGKHSGGNDKSNPNVRTSSFCRNPATLMGIAAAGGGDKKVLNIINKAEYLVRIDISTLAAKGISAHPAVFRGISIVETEYILVPTPGAAECSLTSLATTIYANPFKNCIDNNGMVSIGNRPAVSINIEELAKFQKERREASAVRPETITAEPLDQAHVIAILSCAATSSAAGSKYAQGMIRMKEDFDTGNLTNNALGDYSRAVTR